MKRRYPFLCLNIHPVEGPVSSFVEEDPDAIDRLLEKLHPARIFAHRHLLITDDHSITIFPCKAIARVDLLMEGAPPWPFEGGIADLVEITEEEFARRARPGQDERPGLGRAGGPVAALAEIELANRERLFWEIHLDRKPRLTLEQSLFWRYLPPPPSMHCRRREGGAVIVNPAQVVRWSYYPGPQPGADRMLLPRPPFNSYAPEEDPTAPTIVPASVRN
jgi:hypothetical protein